MKILLLGEYSRLHNSLKEGLTALNHDVTIVGSGDGFKSFPVDYKIHSTFKKNKALFILSKALVKLFKINLIKIEYAIRTYLIIKKLGHFDILQLINEASIKTYPKFEIYLLKKLFKKAKKVFLLSCGEDFYSITHFLKGKEKYSILTPYLNDKSLKKEYDFTLYYSSKRPYKLHEFIANKCDGIIASDLDYHAPLKDNKKYLGVIPNPINIDLISYSPLNLSEKINIFLGINSENATKKGISYFKEALDIIQNKYPEKVSIKITKNLPYKDYIKIYDEAHILLDQVYGYDQGYNALEAMAKSKVVFTGADKQWLDYYKVKEDTIAINALPDANYIAEKLEWLILNPEKIIEISKNARLFIEEKHNYKTIAQQYLTTWKN